MKYRRSLKVLLGVVIVCIISFQFFYQDDEEPLEIVSSVSRDPPLIKEWADYAIHQKCSLKSDSYERIKQNLQPFIDRHQECVKSGRCQESDPIITRGQMERAMAMSSTAKIRIRDGRVSCYGSWQCQEHLLPLLRDLPTLPDVTMVFNALDEPRVLKRKPKSKIFNHAAYNKRTAQWLSNHQNVTDLMEEVCDSDSRNWRNHGAYIAPATFSVVDELVPIFSQATIGACYSDLLIPSFYYMNTQMKAKWSVPLRKPKANWSMKKRTFHWRGSTTGAYATRTNAYASAHRYRFVDYVRNQWNVSGVKTKVDFSGIAQTDKNVERAIAKKYGPLIPTEPYSAMIKYKYLPDIDGNTFSQRFLTFLRFSQSLIFKIAAFEDWLTINTEPYKHYVPINIDLSDMNEKVQWARDHDEEARQIAVNAQIHAKHRLRYQDMQCYLYRLILEYHALTLPQ
jgi:hypothetical protein